MMATLLSLAGYLVYIVCMLMLSGLVVFAMSEAFPNLPDFIKGLIGLIALILPFALKNFIFEFLPGSLRFLTYMMATLLSLAGYLVYLACMVALSWLVLIIANSAIQRTRRWWPELIHTSIVGLTLLLLNMIWGSPFEKPSAASDMKAALVGLAGYLIYIVCSMALSYDFFGASLLLKTFVISLTFVLLHMFVKPSSVSDIIAAHVGLITMIPTPLLAMFSMVALSFVAFVFVHTWAEILLPSARRDYPVGTFASIVGLTFMGMKTMLDMPVDKPSIFSDMKAELLGIADMINYYHIAYLVIRYLTVLAVSWLSMESRRISSMCQLYTMAGFIVALGLVLTMPPCTPTENPASTLVLDDYIRRKIPSFFIHTILVLITLIGGMVFHGFPEAKINILDLVYKSTKGWLGEKDVRPGS